MCVAALREQNPQLRAAARSENLHRQSTAIRADSGSGLGSGPFATAHPSHLCVFDPPSGADVAMGAHASVGGGGGGARLAVGDASSGGDGADDDESANLLGDEDMHDCYAQITFREFVIYVATLAYFLCHREIHKYFLFYFVN